MGPFLLIRRREIVELATPWDPARMVEDYPDAARSLTPDDLAELSRGGLLRFRLKARFGISIESEMRLTVTAPTDLEVEIDGALNMPWWIRPLAVLFRPRLRRWVDRRIDEMLKELAETEPNGEAIPTEREGAIAEQSTGAEAEHDDEEKGMIATLQILSPSGRTLYERTVGSL